MMSSLEFPMMSSQNRKFINQFYDYTKDGTNIVDQKLSYFSCWSKSRRWTVAAFLYFLDTYRINASTVMALNKKQDPKKKGSFAF